MSANGALLSAEGAGGIGLPDNPLPPKPIKIGKGHRRALEVWRSTRRGRVAYLVALGKTYADISRQLTMECGTSVSHQTVRVDSQRALSAAAERDANFVERERARDLSRVDAALAVWLPILLEPMHKKSKQASDTCRWLLARRARLLGVDVAARQSDAAATAIVQINNAVPKVEPKTELDLSLLTDAEVTLLRMASDRLRENGKIIELQEESDNGQA